MSDNQDIYKIVVSVIMIHICLIFIFEGFAITSNNVNDTIALQFLSDAIGDTQGVNSQIAEVGLCLQGTSTQEECESLGCVWDDGICYNALEETTGIDFGFYDVIMSILRIATYLGKFILFLGAVAFFELILSFKLMPLIQNIMLQFFVTLTLWVYQGIVIYYLWAFVSNWRGQR